MDAQEARSLLAEQIARFRARSYADLVAIIGLADCIEIAGPSGQSYQVELNVFWDHKPGGNVRVAAAIDDGSFRASFSPLSDDFIIAPDGSFVGEG